LYSALCGVFEFAGREGRFKAAKTGGNQPAAEEAGVKHMRKTRKTGATQDCWRGTDFKETKAAIALCNGSLCFCVFPKIYGS
jgi:hypothetical protein